MLSLCINLQFQSISSEKSIIIKVQLFTILVFFSRKKKGNCNIEAHFNCLKLWPNEENLYFCCSIFNFKLVANCKYDKIRLFICECLVRSYFQSMWPSNYYAALENSVHLNFLYCITSALDFRCSVAISSYLIFASFSAVSKLIALS